MILQRHSLRLFIAAALLFSSCGLRGGCGSKSGGVDLYQVMPDSVAAVLEINVEDLYATQIGRRSADSLIQKEDCLHPLVSGKMKSILVGYTSRGGEGSAPFALMVCRKCDVDSLAACMAGDFGLAFGEKGGFSYKGLEFISSDSKTAFYLSEVRDDLFLIGRKVEVKRVAAVAAGEKPSLASSANFKRLRGFLPADPAASLIVLRAKDLKEGGLASGNEFAEDIMGFRRAVAGLEISKGELLLSGRVLYGGGKGGPPRKTASDLDEKLALLCLNPLVKQIGLSLFLDRIKIRDGNEGWIELSFAAKEKELIDFMDEKKDFLTFGL